MRVKLQTTPKPEAEVINGVRQNDDAFLANPEAGLFAVLDGASSRGGLSGRVASQTVQRVLNTIQPNESLVDCVKRANQELMKVNVTEFEKLIDDLVEKEELPENFRQKFDQAKTVEGKIPLIPKAFMAATTLAAVQFKPDGTLDWVHAGDAMFAYQQSGTNDDKDGKVQIPTTDDVSKSDYASYLAQQQAWEEVLREESDGKTQQEKSSVRSFIREQLYLPKSVKAKGTRVNLAKMQELAEKSKTSIKPSIEDVIRSGRDNANRDSETGYSVLDGTPEANDFIKSGNIDIKKERIDRIGLLSDGLAMPMRRLDQTGEKPWENSFKVLFKHGMDKLHQIVESLEARDPAAILFGSRLKQRDDRTAVLIEDVKDYVYGDKITLEAHDFGRVAADHDRELS